MKRRVLWLRPGRMGPKAALGRVPLFGILALFAVVIAGCNFSTEPETPRGLGEGPRIGYRAPNFRLNNLEGKEISLARTKGKLVFINFWATWCVPCKLEMPSMEALYQKYREQGLEILAISNDLQGVEVVSPFVEELGLTYPVLMDEDFRVNEKYLVRSLPTTILVGRDGVITHIYIGARNWETPEAENLIQRLLDAKN
jgi:peroxiredoxin